MMLDCKARLLLLISSRTTLAIFSTVVPSALPLTLIVIFWVVEPPPPSFPLGTIVPQDLGTNSSGHFSPTRYVLFAVTGHPFSLAQSIPTNPFTFDTTFPPISLILFTNHTTLSICAFIVFTSLPTNHTIWSTFPPTNHVIASRILTNVSFNHHNVDFMTAAARQKNPVIESRFLATRIATSDIPAVIIPSTTLPIVFEIFLIVSQCLSQNPLIFASTLSTASRIPNMLVV